MFQPHLLHLLLNLCNLKITKYKFVNYDLVTLLPNNTDLEQFSIECQK